MSVFGLLFGLFLIASALGKCSSENITAIEIMPSFSNTPGDGVQLMLNRITMPADSFSICLRVSFSPWSGSQYLVSSDNFEIILYGMKDGVGNFLSYSLFTSMPPDATLISFGWKNILLVLTSIWNSICLTYDAPIQSVNIVINGEIVKKSTLVRALGKLGSTITVGKWLASGGVQLTDICVWSRVLAAEEVHNITVGKGNDSFLKSKPDLFNWKNQSGSINLVSNNTRLVKINGGKVHAYNAIFQKNQVYKFRTYQFDWAQKVCRRLNGKFINPTVFNLQLSESTDEFNVYMCSNKFWVPVKRSNSSKWVTVIKNELSREISLEPLNKKETQQPGDCIYFNTLTQSFYESDCRVGICSLCEMSHERFIFTLRSECDQDFAGLDDQFILQPATAERFYGSFSGESNQNRISMGVNSQWGLYRRTFFDKNETLLAELNYKNGEIVDVIGLNTWKVHQCGNKEEALVKLTNVSSGPKSF